MVMATSDNGSTAGQLVIPRGRRASGGGLDVGVRVWAKARLFNDDWAKETFGRDWTTAKVYGKIVREEGKNEWLVEFDPVEEGDDPDECQ